MNNFYSLALRFAIRRPAKTFGSAIGIALGVAVIVTAVSAGGAAKAQLSRSTTSILGAADLVVSHVRPFDAAPAEKALEGLPVEAKAGQLFYPARIGLGSDRSTNEFLMVSVLGIDAKESRALWPMKMAAGNLDFSKGNVVLSQPLANRLRSRPGDEIELFTGAGPLRKRVAGIMDETGLGNQGIPAVYTDLKTAQKDQQLGNKLSYLFLKLKPGAEAAAVKNDLSRRLGADLKVGRTPATSVYVLNMFDLISQILLALGLCALVVGTLLIYQSTSVAAKQMVPTLALIKALGATKRQLIRVFLLESVLIGAFASVVGGAIGLAAAKSIAALLSAFLAAGRPQPVVTSGLLLMMLFLGVGVSVTATCLPIIRSSRAPVAEILRPIGPMRRRGSGPVIGFFTGIIDFLLEKVRPSSVVAWRNLSTNFGRLRFISVCLIAGLAMIIGTQMGLSTFMDSADQYFSIYRRQSFVIRGQEMVGGDVGIRMPLSTARQLKKLVGVKDAPPFYLGSAHYSNREIVMQSAALREAKEDWVYLKGSPTLAVDRFSSGGWVAVSTAFAKKSKVGVGDSIVLEAGGLRRRFRVAAVILSLRDGVSVSWPDLRKHFNIANADEFEVLPANGASYRKLGDRLERFTRSKGYFLLTSKQFKEQMNGFMSAFGAILLTITGSVLLLVALALANMMVIGALERRRVLGVLRGQGMTRRQLAGLLVSESVAIGILSLPAGMALGFVVGQVFIRFIREEMGMTMNGAISLRIFPLSALALIFILFVSAVFPARRIAATPVAEALRYE